MASQDRDPKTLGGGAEAAEGVHSLQQSDGDSGAGDPGASDAGTGDDRSGSEPLPRTREHAPSYGGAGGQPRTGSGSRPTRAATAAGSRPRARAEPRLS
jgi:hypothetical protein